MKVSVISFVAFFAVCASCHDLADEASLLQAPKVKAPSHVKQTVNKLKSVSSAMLRTVGKPLSAMQRLTKRRKSVAGQETVLASAGRTKYQLSSHSEAEQATVEDARVDSETEEQVAHREESKARSKAFAVAASSLLEIIASQAWVGEKLLDLGDKAMIKEFGSRRLQLDRVKTMSSLEQELQRMHLLEQRLSKVAAAEAQRRSNDTVDLKEMPSLDVAAMVKYLSRQNMDGEKSALLESFVMQAWRDRLFETTGRKVPLANEWPMDLNDAVYLAAGKDHVYKNQLKTDSGNKDYFSLLLRGKSEALDRLSLARRTNSSGFDWKEGEMLKRDWALATSVHSLKDIEAHDKFMHPNCEKKPITAFEGSGLFFKVTDQQKKPNTRAWCYNYPNPAVSRMTAVSEKTLIDECLDKKHLDKFARIYYEQQVRAGLGDIEASLCFAEGHCDNEVLHENSTAADGEQTCDMKYGAKAWREMGLRDGKEQAWWQHTFITKEHGIRDPWVSKYFGMLSCAMGHYHCDVHMCKETFCKNPYFRKHYANHREKLMSGEIQPPPLKSAYQNAHDGVTHMIRHPGLVA